MGGNGTRNGAPLDAAVVLKDTARRIPGCRDRSIHSASSDHGASGVTEDQTGGLSVLSGYRAGNGTIFDRPLIG